MAPARGWLTEAWLPEATAREALGDTAKGMGCSDLGESLPGPSARGLALAEPLTHSETRVPRYLPTHLTAFGDRRRAVRVGQHRQDAHEPPVRQARQPPPRRSGGPGSRPRPARTHLTSRSKGTLSASTRPLDAPPCGQISVSRWQALQHVVELLSKEAMLSMGARGSGQLLGPHDVVEIGRSRPAGRGWHLAVRPGVVPAR